MKNRRVAICHQVVSHGDAIGNDIMGMRDLLTAVGFEPTILCDYVKDLSCENIRTDFDVKEINDFEIVIYHHSIFWEKGASLVDRYNGTLVLKHHNITPPHFFEAYSDRYVDLCARGVELTRRFVNLKKKHYWWADSEYDRSDLIDAGEQPDRISVLPPFNKIDDILDNPNVAEYESDGPFYGLFIGRMAPNKGHANLLKILHAYRMHFPSDFIIRLVGSWDPELSRYRAELETLMEDLGLDDCVEFFPQVSQDDLVKLLRTSHVYLCASYHEGFCIPLIEAQASGLPMVAMKSTAVQETAGDGQLVAPEPMTDADYFFYARLLHEVFTSGDLRQTIIRKGYQNVTTRFTKELIENKFLEILFPLIRRSL